MKRLCWLSAFILMMYLLSSSASAQIVWETPSTDSERIGLVVGAWGPEAKAVDEALSVRVAASDGVLVRRVPIARDAHDEVSGEVEQLREKGRELYFYSDEKSVIEYLTPRLDEKLEISQSWMGHAGTSKALFEAVIYLVRSHLDRGHDELADHWMTHLVRALPAHHCDEQICPPDVQKRWRSTRQMMMDSAQLDLSTWNGDRGCAATINGAATDDVVAVETGRTYLLTRECGDQEPARRWWISARGEEINHVEALDETLNTEALTAAFDRWQQRWDLDTVVYVGPGVCGGVCVAVRSRTTGHRDVELREFRRELLKELVVPTTTSHRRERSPRSSYAGDANSPRPWATQIANNASASRYQVSIYPKWVSAVR